MSNIKEAFQRFLSIALSVTTTVWLSGITLLLPVSPVVAATPAQYGLKEGDLVRAPSLPAPDGWKVYIINNNGYKRHIFNPDVFNMYGHLKWSNIKDVSADTVNAFITSDVYRIDGDPRVWSVDPNGVKHWLNMTAEQYVQKGYSWNQIFLVNPTEGNYYTMGSDMTFDGTTPPPATGGVSVSLSPNTPATAVLAAGTVFNKATTLRFSAGANGGSVTGITVSKSGLLGNTLVTGISIWQGMNRQGNILTALTSDGKATFTLGTPISVPANSYVDIDVAVNISSSATSGTFAFGVNSASDITLSGGATVSGTFPVTGNGHSVVSSTALGAYTITAQAVGGNSASTDAANLEIGVAQKEIGKFQFNETSGREDLLIKQVVVYSQGSIQANDLKNWKLYAPDGTVIGEGTVNMPYITFNLTTAYKVPEGTNRTLSVKADPLDGSDRTLRLHIQNDYDVMVAGSETGSNIAPSSFTDQAASDGWFRLKQGALTISVNASSPSGDIAAGATEAELARFDLRATGETLEIRKMDLEVLEASTTSAQQLTGNIKVQSEDGLTTYLSVAADTTSLQVDSVADQNAARHDLNNYIVIPSGTTKTIKIIGTVKTTATATQTFTAQIANFYTYRQSTKDFTDLNAAYVLGRTLTVKVSSLAVARDSSIAAKTVATGSNNVAIGSFVIQSGSSEAINISSVSIKYDTEDDQDMLASEDDASADLTNVSLWIDGVQFGSTVGTPATGVTADTFSGTYALAKSSTKTLVVKANVKTDAADTVKVYITALSATGASTSNSITATHPNDGDSDLDADSTAGENLTDDFPDGQKITFGSGSLTITRDGGSPTSRVMTAGQTMQELNRFRFEALNDTLTLNKIRFETTDTGGIAGGGGKYIKKAYLFNGATNLTPSGITPTPNSTTSEMLFEGLSVSIPSSGSATVLTLKADLSDYSIITAAADVDTLGVQVKSDSSDDLQVVGTSSGTLAVGSINGSGSNANIGQSQIYLFHAATPVIAKGTVSSTTLGGSTAQEMYKFTLRSATAGVPVRVGQIKIAVTATGFSGADLIQTFELWKDGVKVAQDTTTTIGPTGTASSTATITFSSSNDVNDAFDPDSSVATALDGIEISDTDAVFVVKANTTAATAAGATGTNSVTTQLTGNTSYDAADTDQEDDWGDGNVFYSYRMDNTQTYIGGTDSSTGFTASQSYPVDAQVLSITI